ncbi:metallopeptidase family protein [Corynebacterium sp. TAE3-ERU12]|uniref:metallopeptidase family protein n=1 Tax=Corynebacterium sp. TAE3-ERU12 TaxID=2849491 RepID=UPI001C43B1BF|nr:metallopeptidase family protein [Corynebacterium sp. TAE3-ERU12]MBV7296081.1 metallopeptidase family protein [Corynebacterium sp. TAE3-ERU12]
MVTVSKERFDELVDEAIDEIPQRFFSHMRNTVIMVEEVNPHTPTLMGLYEGVPMTKRVAGEFNPPDVITLYRSVIQRVARDEDDLVEQIRVTLLHEVGHLFGMEEEDLDRLGYG